MALGNSKQLRNQMSYRPANRLKRFRKAYSTYGCNIIKKYEKMVAQAVLENTSTSVVDRMTLPTMDFGSYKRTLYRLLGASTKSPY